MSSTAVATGKLRLSRAMLFVKDIATMTEFYIHTLGLDPVAETRLDNYVEFSCGFALHAIPEEIATGITIASPPKPREQTPTKLSFAAADPKAEEARLRNLGVPYLERAWGATDWVDPEGNVFAICAERH